jgi:hypothetical protein
MLSAAAGHDRFSAADIAVATPAACSWGTAGCERSSGRVDKRRHKELIFDCRHRPALVHLRKMGEPG